jgi:hypothetical protein
MAGIEKPPPLPQTRTAGSTGSETACAIVQEAGRWEPAQAGRLDMGTLFKLAFWGGLALLFIPIDTGASDDSRRVSALEAIVAARATVEDIRGICHRQPDVCATGSAALETIGERAKVSARMLLEYVGETENTPTPPAIVNG